MSEMKRRQEFIDQLIENGNVRIADKLQEDLDSPDSDTQADLRLEYARRIFSRAKANSMRTGEWLVNTFPGGARRAIVATSIDPYEVNFNVEGLYNWLKHHAILSNNGLPNDPVRVVALMGNGNYIWIEN